MICPLIFLPPPAINTATKLNELKQSFPQDLLIVAHQENYALWPSAKIEEAFQGRCQQLKLNDFIHSLPQMIIATATDRQVKLGTAESCTGGLAASLLTDVAGSSAAIQGGVVSYSNEVKIQLLGVSARTLAEHGAVSIPVASAMAQGAAKALGADFVVSFSGIAGPGGGSVQKPVGTVAIGIYEKGEAYAQMYQFYGDRLSLKRQFAMQGLLQIWAALNRSAQPSPI